ncbi:MAG: hypothetical protein EU529_06445 [Promethearchaeota archaeon]|nr:MAG: hypothetical protein EU529_06445 [Candidatus Lokiarchaeota archaeon]
MSVKYNGKNYVAKESLKLEFLEIKSIKEIKGLDELSSLKKLYLDGNLINEITGLDNLKNLETLSLQNNNIKEIQGLENLINLKNIYLSENPVFDWVVNKFGKKYRNNAQLLVEYCYINQDKVITKEDYELVRKVLKFEFANQRPITKAEMADELHFSISEIATYVRIINQNISYNKGDELDLKNSVDQVIKLFSTPSLYDFIISLNLNFEKAVKLGNYLIKEGWINDFPNFPIKDDYEDCKLVKRVLKFEYDNQRKANKVDMLHELDFKIDEIRNYFKIIDQRISYKKEEIEELEKYAEQVIKQFPSPTLYDLIISFNLNYEKAIKLGQYLIEERIIKDFPDYPVKERDSFDEGSIEKVKRMVKVSDRINLDMMRTALKMDKEVFSEKIFEWADKFDFRIDADMLIVNEEKVGEFIDALEEDVSVFRDKKVCLVCKGEPSGFNVFICPECDSIYCDKCARALSDLENLCWVCESPLDQSKPVKKEEPEQEEIKISKDIKEGIENKKPKVKKK